MALVSSARNENQYARQYYDHRFIILTDWNAESRFQAAMCHVRLKKFLNAIIHAATGWNKVEILIINHLDTQFPLQRRAILNMLFGWSTIMRSELWWTEGGRSDTRSSWALVIAKPLGVVHILREFMGNSEWSWRVPLIKLSSCDGDKVVIKGDPGVVAGKNSFCPGIPEWNGVNDGIGWVEVDDRKRKKRRSGAGGDLLRSRPTSKKNSGVGSRCSEA